MDIKVKIKNVYGVDRIYPVCPRAELFCKLIEKKTFSKENIRIIKELGCEVIYVNGYPQN